MKTYEAPEIDIISLKMTDVINSSPPSGGGDDWGAGEGYLPGA